MKQKTWDTLSSRTILDLSPWFSVIRDSIRLPSGRTVDDFYRIEAPDYVLVSAQNLEGNVLFERQFKQCLGRVILTSPAGGVEPGETPLEAARRELMEETGYSAKTWKYLGGFMVDGTRGICRAHMLLATGIEKSGEARQDEMEQCEIIFLGRGQINEAIRKGEIALLPDLALLAMTASDLFADRFPGGVPGNDGAL